MDVSGTSKRRFKRIRISIRGGIVHRGTFSFADFVSLSEGGMLISTPVPLKTGDPIEVQLTIESEIICAKAEAIYILPPPAETPEENQVGVKFSQLAFRDLRIIRSFIRHSD
jgi:hypothetical protein